RKSVKRLTFDTIVRRDNTHDHLNDNQCCDYPEVFDDGTHRRCCHNVKKRIFFGDSIVYLVVLIPRIVENKNSYTEQKHNHTESCPQHQVTCRPVSYQLLCRPVMCIGNLFAGAIRYAGPGCPKEEGA